MHMGLLRSKRLADSMGAALCVCILEHLAREAGSGSEMKGGVHKVGLISLEPKKKKTEVSARVLL